jgi:peptidoglycan biosynthesis protein MviN/MurJ (putative lipid II flippase)
MKRFLILATLIQVGLVVFGYYSATGLAFAGLMGTGISAVIGFLYARSQTPTLWGGFVGGGLIGLLSATVAVTVALALTQPLWALLGPGPISVPLVSAVAAGLGGILGARRTPSVGSSH